MHNIFLDFTINSPLGLVFDCVSQPDELSKWWTKDTVGDPKFGARYILNFGPDFKWEAVVSKFATNEEFELLIEIAQQDWAGTRVGFRLTELSSNKTKVQFITYIGLSLMSISGFHAIVGYVPANPKQYLENGLNVSYEQRLEV